jgi:peroxiredoxin
LPDQSLSTQEKDELTQELYRRSGHPLDLFNGPDGAQHLPVPATFLIDEKGVIRLAHVDVDYTRRLDPENVITTLRRLKA